MSDICLKPEEYKYSTFYLVSAISSSLCALCCLIVIYSFVRFRNSVSHEYRIVFFLQIADLIYSISNLFFPKCENMQDY